MDDYILLDMHDMKKRHTNNIMRWKYTRKPFFHRHHHRLLSHAHNHPTEGGCNQS